jgi:hypothetical protein
MGRRGKQQLPFRQWRCKAALSLSIIWVVLAPVLIGITVTKDARYRYAEVLSLDNLGIQARCEELDHSGMLGLVSRRENQ